MEDQNPTTTKSPTRSAREQPQAPGEYVVTHDPTEIERVRQEQSDAHAKRVADAEAANLATNKRAEDLQRSYVKDSRR